LQCTLAAAITWNTPDSIVEVQPIRHAASGVVVVADCRLDNRHELIARLEPAESASGDCDLILNGWLRWGEACVSHFLGDFAFALWDPRERVLFCASDPFGCRPLYYARIGKGVLVASNPAIILGHPAMDGTISAQWLTESLASIPGAGLETPFAALKRLPGGHYFTFHEGGISEREYWRPQPGSLAGLGTEHAIIEQGRHLLTESVACRLRTAWPVGAELTGGLDSGGIVATALPMLRGRSEDLAVFSRLRAPTHAFLGSDESAGVASLCEHLGIRRRFASGCTGPGLLDLLCSVLKRHAIPLCPWAIFSEEMRALAKGQGIRTMLSGFAGDNCFSASESSLPAMERGLRGWQWRWSHQRAAAQREKNGHFIKPFAGVLFATFAPRISRLRARLNAGPDPAASLAEMIMASAEFWAGSGDRLRGELRWFTALTGDRRTTLLANRQLQFRITSNALLAAPYKQVCTYPLLDKRLVEFALACPPQIRTAQGWTRRLARLVIEDRVPASLAWNPRKGRETISGAMEQVADNRDTIGARLGSWRSHPLVASVFDLDRAIAALGSPIAETPVPWVLRACGVVDVLQLGEFLTRHLDPGMKALEAIREGYYSTRP
jgi:asparagine synthase (glutamine-hydrolysing)